MTTTTRWTDGNGNWMDPTWSNGVPDSNANAIINGTSAHPLTVTFDDPAGAALSLNMQYATLAITGGTLTLAENTTADSKGPGSTLDALTQSGGLLEIDGKNFYTSLLQVDGPVFQTGGTIEFVLSQAIWFNGPTMLGGTIEGEGVAAALPEASTTISGLTLTEGAILETDGPVTQTGPLTIATSPGDVASVSNLQGWTLASADADIIGGSPEHSFFYNEGAYGGSFTDIAAGTITISTNFTNGGIVENASPGGTLLFSAGTFTNTGGVEALSGNIIFGPGESNASLVNGTLTGRAWAAAAGSTLAITGGPITTIGSGSEVVLVGAGSEIAGGDGSTFTPLEQSLTTIASGAELTISSGLSFSVANTISDGGTITLRDATFTDGSLLKVGPGAAIYGQGTATLAAPIANFGTIYAMPKGTLDVTGPLASHGTLDVAYGATLDLSGSRNTLAGRIDVLGELLFSGGASTIEPGTGGHVGMIMLNAGATLALASNVADLYTFNDVATAGTSTIDLAGHTAKLSHSTFSSIAGGEALIEGGGTLAAVGTMALAGVALDGGTTLENRRTVDQAGSITLGDASGGTASIVNQAGATYTMAGAVSLTAANPTADTVTNNGLFAKTGTGTAVVGADFTNTGTISVQQGTLEITGTFTNTGSIIGTEIQSHGTTFITAPSPALLNQYASAMDPPAAGPLVVSPSVAPLTPTLAAPHAA